MLTRLTKKLCRALPLAFSTQRAPRRRAATAPSHTTGIERLESRSLLSATVAGLETFASRDDLRTFLYGDLKERYEHDFGQPKEDSYRIPKYDWGYLDLGYNLSLIRSAEPTFALSPSTVTDVSGTNNQVAGVDEADQLKSDGQYIYLLSGSDLVIVDSWPVEELSVVSRTQISGKPLVEFLNGDRLIVLSQQDYDYSLTSGRNWVQITVFNVSDRTQPQVVEESRIDGQFLRALMVGDQVQLVVKNGIRTQLWNPYYGWYGYGDGIRATGIVEMGAPSLVFTTDSISMPARVASATSSVTTVGNVTTTVFVPNYLTRYDPLRTTVETRTEFDDYIEVKVVTTFESWDDYNARVFSGNDPLDMVFPGMYQRGDTSGDEWVRTGLVSDPDDIVRPPNRDELSNMVTVATFHLAAANPATSVDTASVFTDWQTFVYQSQDHLYVTDTEYDATLGSNKTVIHQFLIEPTQVTTTAVGEVRGTLLNQFSMDEYAGHFRIATNSSSWSNWNLNIHNDLFVLDTEGVTLEIVGQVNDLAHNERITSARFLGDRGYVVTFRRTDPLFVFDLSSPTDLQLLGELVIPGFSEYLHPLGADYLIGIGQSSQWGGLQVSLFDVSQGHEPKLISREDVTSAGWWNGDWNRTNLGGNYQFDHHAVSFFDEKGILAIPVQQTDYYSWPNPPRSKNRLLVVHVDAANGIQKIGEIAHDHPIQRSLRIGDGLYSVSDNTIKVHDLNDPFLQLGEVNLDPQVSQTWHKPLFNLFAGPLPSNTGSGSKMQDLFDETYYTRTNPDVAAAVAGGSFQTGYEHYLKYGQRESRNPNAFFDESSYRSSNPDVDANVRNGGGFASGFEHFVRYGQFEMRSPSANFDDKYYLGLYADVRQAVLHGGFASGFAHMIKYGQNEGRSPNAFFSETEYLAANSDVAAAVTQGVFNCGLQHYLQYGLEEGRHASDYFNEQAYLSQNPDVAAAVTGGGFSSGIVHFLQYGRHENRPTPLTQPEVDHLDTLFSNHEWFQEILAAL